MNAQILSIQLFRRKGHLTVDGNKECDDLLFVS